VENSNRFHDAMNAEHGSYVKVVPRPLTSQETEWVREIVLSNPQWADAELSNLQVVAECTCGCRSVVLDKPTQPQNAKLIGHQGLVGEIELAVKLDEREGVISVLLHYAEGSLSLLEVIWYNFPEPVPRSWVELSRTVSAGG
jgi:hypothetical protein